MDIQKCSDLHHTNTEEFTHDASLSGLDIWDFAPQPPDIGSNLIELQDEMDRLSSLLPKLSSKLTSGGNPD